MFIGDLDYAKTKYIDSSGITNTPKQIPQQKRYNVIMRHFLKHLQQALGIHLQWMVMSTRASLFLY
ncbi:hypothetical protein COK19_21215 [Bacillus cereus]|nr:hypothetical protein COK19_21215 [Bacillus cereus]